MVLRATVEDNLFKILSSSQIVHVPLYHSVYQPSKYYCFDFWFHVWRGSQWNSWPTFPVVMLVNCSGDWCGHSLKRSWICWEENFDKQTSRQKSYWKTVDFSGFEGPNPNDMLRGVVSLSSRCCLFVRAWVNAPASRIGRARRHANQSPPQPSWDATARCIRAFENTVHLISDLRTSASRCYLAEERVCPP